MSLPPLGPEQHGLLEMLALRAYVRVATHVDKQVRDAIQSGAPGLDLDLRRAVVDVLDDMLPAIAGMVCGVAGEPFAPSLAAHATKRARDLDAPRDLLDKVDARIAVAVLIAQQRALDAFADALTAELAETTGGAS